MVDFALTPRQRELRQIAHDFAMDVVLPATEKADRIPEADKSFDWSIIREGSKRGLRTLSVPKEFGGKGPTCSRWRSLASRSAMATSASASPSTRPGRS